MQIPSEVPKPDNNTPLDFSNPFEVIVYIVIPIALLILYILLRKRRRAKNKSIENIQN
ncbi:MAG: adenylosuccinate synthetase [Flavobacteriaceae bacterium]|nr:adenylosuccinate synthetase [Flavobacteriaceae bacterium]